MKILFVLFICFCTLFLNAQNVGIGTTNPEVNLHITDSLSGVAQAIKLQGNTPYIGFYSLDNDYKGYLWNNGNGMQLGTSNSSPVTIAPSFITAATFMPNGFVGIGTTSPAKRLHVTGNGELLRLQGQQPFIGFMNNTDSDFKGLISYPDTAIVMGTAVGSNKNIVLAPDNIGLLFANPNQRVGIGTSVPDEKLHVNGIVKADQLKYNSPRISYYSIGTPDFTSRDGSYTISREIGSGYASIDQNDPAGLGMVAPIHLPHGSKITQIQIVGRDISTTSDLTISIVTRAYSNLSSFSWITQTSSGAPGNFTINHTLGSPLVVENDLNYYMIQVSGTAGWNATQLGIYGVRITYSVEKAD